MTVELSNDKKSIVITLPIISKKSGSGKTTIVASTGGNQLTQVLVEGKPVIVGANAYIKP